jgi:hypothetical protein
MLFVDDEEIARPQPQPEADEAQDVPAADAEAADAGEPEEELSDRERGPPGVIEEGDEDADA